MTTGERIRQARKSAGMTQAELAHKLGISAAGIAQWENDLRNPKIETLRKLADALGVTPGYLLYGDTDPVQRSLFDAEDTAKALKGELQKSLETGKITPALTNGKAAKALSVLENQMWTAVDEIGKESGRPISEPIKRMIYTKAIVGSESKKVKTPVNTLSKSVFLKRAM